MRPDRLNFLPKHLQASPMNAKNGMIAGWVFCTVIMISLSTYKLIEFRHLTATFEKLSETAKTVDAQLEDARKTSAQLNRATNRVTEGKEFLSSKVSWTGALKELSLLIPKKVWISNFSMKRNDRGEYLEIIGSAPSQDKIASFLNSLEMSYYFRNAILRKSEKQLGVRPDLYKFELEISVPQLVARGP